MLFGRRTIVRCGAVTQAGSFTEQDVAGYGLDSVCGHNDLRCAAIAHFYECFVFLQFQHSGVRTGFLQAADALEDGIYLFGHTHCQWQLTSRDGRKLFLNPGSCGLPLDGGAGTTPYALVEISPNGTWQAESIRIPFDRAAACRAIRESSQFAEAHVWSDIVCRELETGLEHMTFFLEYMAAYARRIGDDRRPYAVDTWENGWRQWLLEWKP